MSALPLETLSNILRYSEIGDYPNLCLSSPQFYSLCSSRGFWVNKFQEDNLPLLLEGNTPREWVEIYKQTKDSLELAQDLVKTVSRERVINIFSFTLEGYEPPEYFTTDILTYDMVKESLLKLQRTRLVRLTKDLYSSPKLSKHLRKKPLYQTPQTTFIVECWKENNKIYYSFPDHVIKLKPQGLEKLLTKLLFFRLTFANLTMY